jgi:hypothetical protein
MNLDDIFAAYWTQYRGDSDIPATTDPEYTVGLRLANEAINHWETYDGTVWKELFAYFKDVETATVSAGTTEYDAPADFKRAEGKVRILDSDNKTVQRYPVIDTRDVQFRSDSATYAYFSGNPAEGYVLHLNPAPPSSLSGKKIDYPYRKAATTFASGSDITEMSDPYFIVHRMLANRFRSSRNPYYTDAKEDAENSLGKMKTDNDDGDWGNPPKLEDRSGSSWGS